MVYNPQAFGGRGGVGVNLAGQVHTYPLEPGAKASGATFTRFGMMAPRAGGNSMRIYFDELHYSKARGSWGSQSRGWAPRVLAPSNSSHAFCSKASGSRIAVSSGIEPFRCRYRQCMKRLSPGGEIGRRTGLKIPEVGNHRAGSSPALGTNLKSRAMFTITVVLRKPKVSVDEFRRIWRDVYGPMYRQMPQVRSYVQYHLADRRKDPLRTRSTGIAIIDSIQKKR